MRLLQKTVYRYIVYSVFVLLVAIPVFYLAIKQIVKEDTDEHLQVTQSAIKPRIVKAIQDHSVDRLTFAEPDILLSPSRDPTSSESLTDQDLYDSVSAETVPYRILTTNFVVDGRPYLLQIKNSMLDGEDLIASIVKVQVVLLLLLLSGLLLINRGLSKKIWRPFYTTLDKLRNYKVEKHPSLGLIKSSVNEFDDLNESLEELAGRAHQTYLIQKEFTENAAHEMQTPLAIFKSKVELLMQTSPVNEEQAELIGEMADASQRMGKLNQSLILLTRIENLQFTETEPISLSAVIEKAILQFQPQWEEKRLSIRFDPRGDFVAEANRSLLEILVGNLLSNAISHNFQVGEIDIALTSKQFVIQNSGRTLGLDPQQIFRRFHKESDHANSIGLGLAIVRQISDLYGWAIHYDYAWGLHVFTILFSQERE